MTKATTDTVFALSSAAGKAGLSVIRVSGSKAWESLAALTHKDKLPAAHKGRLMTLRNLKTGEIIDKALIIGFKAPASFTGEDVIEYHCHGSLAVVDEMLAVLGSFDGHRLAEPGEYTRRAFENGKMDLTEAEAVADLIDAETTAQKNQALMQMGGALANLYNGWAKELTKALAYVEAIIDFPDEDVPDTETQKAIPAIEKITAEIKDHLNDNRRGERLRQGIHVAVIGAPNAGKSSLVNALTQRDVAIVSSIAGTTRDIIEAHLNLGGYPVILADTAGLRPDQLSDDAQGSIESEGIQRALKRAIEADIRLLVFDGSADKVDHHTLDLIDENAIVLMNKSEIANAQMTALLKDYQAYTISVKTGAGLAEFLNHLTSKIKALMGSRSAGDAPSLTRRRHRAALESALENLTLAIAQDQPELMAQELRIAMSSLGRITGRVDVEDLLDVIFRDFCIGK